MEDILASIRRILNEDESAPAKPDVLALDPSMLVGDASPPPAPPESSKGTGAVSAEHGHAKPTPAPPPAPEAVPVEASSSETPTVVPPSMVAPAAAAAAASSVSAMLQTLKTERQQVAVTRNGPTIEDLVREELRPFLKEWLDANLPAVVERLVRAEVERILGRALS
jgi:cell pole-organizing protein PopZ